MYLLLQFSLDRFEIIQGSSIRYKHYDLCFFDDRIKFEVWANFGNLGNNGIIYSNCKMHLPLRYSFNHLKIIQGFFVGYRKYGLCFFDDRTIFWRFFLNI